MRLLKEDDVFDVVERVTNEAIEKGLRKATIQKSLVYELGLLKPVEIAPIKHGFKNIDYSAYIDTLENILDEATEDENSVCYVTDVDAPALRAAINVLKAVVSLDKESEDEDESS